MFWERPREYRPDDPDEKSGAQIDTDADGPTIAEEARIGLSKESTQKRLWIVNHNQPVPWRGN
jgi:hypothetical protein